MDEKRLEENWSILAGVIGQAEQESGIPLTDATEALNDLIAEVRRLRNVICGPAIAAMPQDLLKEIQLRQAAGMANIAWRTTEAEPPESAPPRTAG